jgi:hypothetical protein
MPSRPKHIVIHGIVHLNLVNHSSIALVLTSRDARLAVACGRRSLVDPAIAAALYVIFVANARRR